METRLAKSQGCAPEMPPCPTSIGVGLGGFGVDIGDSDFCTLSRQCAGYRRTKSAARNPKTHIYAPPFGEEGGISVFYLCGFRTHYSD